MNVVLIEVPSTTIAADETSSSQTFMVEGLPHVTGIEDILGKEVAISELRSRVQELIDADGNAMEGLEVDKVIPYKLPATFTEDASEHLTIIPPPVVLRVVLDALVERYGDSEHKVMLR